MITCTYNPETHKLVPKDLADDTIDAACDAGGLYRVEFVRAWDAALDAAPEAPEQAEMPAVLIDGVAHVVPMPVAVELLRLHIEALGQPRPAMMQEQAAPQQGEREAEHDSKDRRCECCGYMTYHREHLGCIRAAARAHQPPPAKADRWQQYAKPGETAQQCIERHRAEQDALMTLLAQARAEQAAKAAPSCALRLKLGGR